MCVCVCVCACVTCKFIFIHNKTLFQKVCRSIRFLTTKTDIFMIGVFAEAADTQMATHKDGKKSEIHTIGPLFNKRNHKPLRRAVFHRKLIYKPNVWRSMRRSQRFWTKLGVLALTTQCSPFVPLLLAQCLRKVHPSHIHNNQRWQVQRTRGTGRCYRCLRSLSKGNSLRFQELFYKLFGPVEHPEQNLQQIRDHLAYYCLSDYLISA